MPPVPSGPAYDESTLNHEILLLTFYRRRLSFIAGRSSLAKSPHTLYPSQPFLVRFFADVEEKPRGGLGL